jgi:integrase
MPEPATVADVIDRYLQHAEAIGLFCAESLTQRLRTLGEFKDKFGALSVTDCRAFWLADWIEQHAGWRSSSTRKAAANAVNAAFNWAAKQGRIEKNPFATINYAEAEPRPPMPDDDLAILAEVCNKAFERALRFLRLTGCRLSEMCGLTWPDVNLDRGIAVIHQHKSRKHTRKSKAFALVPEAVELLQEVRRRQKPSYAGVIFLNNHNRPWTRRTPGQQLRRLKLRHNLTTPATLHGIRHMWGSRAIANGAPLKLVSAQLGHATTAITERYYCDLSNEMDAIRQAARFALPDKPI